MNEYYQPPESRYLQEQSERRGVKYVGIVSGICVISYVIIQNVMSLIVAMTPLRELYFSDPTMQSVVTIFMSIFSLLVPFGIGGMLINRKTGDQVFNFEKPVSGRLMAFAVPLGFFVCLVGNYVSSIFVNIMSDIGFNLSAPDFDVPSDIPGRIVYLVSIAVVPALVEEFAIRGAVLQPLRRYGDKFAIIASAIIFAVLHGNLIQAPFALIAGVALGYAVCITNSIWTGVLIHFCNNLYSVIIEFLIADIADEQLLNRIYIIVMLALYAVSILGSVIFVIVKGKRKLMPSFTLISEGQKMKSFLINLPMVIAILIMLKITAQNVSFG
ncbi:MAG: lysostaphin resistance A-like protein [Acutalibacteraceae bacterium]